MNSDTIYGQNFAQHYDLMYDWKNYAQDALLIKAYIEQHKKTDGTTLLEIACGTGLYIAQLRADFQITGLDLSQPMLNIAKHKFPNLPFVCADMRTFKLNQTFDVILCLFSSIAYLTTHEELSQALSNFYAHLNRGGIALVEPFISPNVFRENNLSAVNIDKPDIKLSRQSISTRKQHIAHIDMHTLVTTLQTGSLYFHEQHRLSLFSHTEYLEIAEKVGFKAQILSDGLMKDRNLILLCKA